MSDFDAGDDGGNCVGEGTKRASKGTIQLLDHLGHGFVDGMVGIEGGEGDTCYCEGEKQRAPSAPERFVAGKVASSKGAASSAAGNGTVAVSYAAHTGHSSSAFCAIITLYKNDFRRLSSSTTNERLQSTSKVYVKPQKQRVVDIGA